MRLLQKARQRIQALIQNMRRPDRALIARVVPRKIPTLTQLQHIDLFLDTWEKNLIGGLSFFAFISFIGIFWSFKLLNTIPTPVQGGAFDEVLVGNPRHINPIFAVTDTDRTLSNVLFLPLCDIYHRNIPVLATSCEITDQKIATITLGNRTWHDGKPVTADDIIYTIQVMQNSKVGSPWRSLASRVSIETDTTGHIIIKTKQTTPELKTLLSLRILPKHVWISIAPEKMMQSPLNTEPIGSGSFMFKSIARDRDGFVETLNLTAFEDFKPHRAYLDELNFRIATDDIDAYDLFRTRQVTALFLRDPSVAEELVKQDVHRFESTPPVIISLFFNPTHTQLFKKREVRQAFAHAIDRTKIIKEALRGGGIPVRTPFPSSLLKTPNATQSDFNAVEAAELFKKNNIAPSTPITFTLGIPSTPVYAQIAETIKTQLAPFGITVIPNIIGSGTKTGTLLSYDLLLLGQDYTNNNPIPFWHTSATNETGTNYARYQIKEVDTWLEQLQSSVVDETRETLLKKLNNRLVFDNPAIFLFQPTYQYYTLNKIQGMSSLDSLKTDERFSHITDWFTHTKLTKK